jgi:hypothetical protein
MATIDGATYCSYRDRLTDTCAVADCDHRAITVVDGTLLCGTHGWAARYSVAVA